MKAIADAGFEPGAWTVNDAERMRKLRDMGVYRFYTDYPRRCFETKRAGTGTP